MRKYEAIWEKLKAAEADQWVLVQASSAAHVETIVNMVCIEKSAAQVTRRRLDLPAFGKLEVRRDKAKCQVSFRLKNSGDLL
jgi:nucleoid DNA-binding protein